jgi:Uma2 family endonuclease
MDTEPDMPLPVMSRDAFRQWAEALPRGRYERLDGRPVAKEVERIGHNRVKMLVWQTLREAVRTFPVPCTAYGDGITVEVGEHTDYEPDAVLNLGPPLSEDRYDAPNPLVIVEVTSPSTSRIDRTRKLADYFSLPSVQHYLVIEARERRVLHYRRAEAGLRMDTIPRDGTVPLPALGVTLAAGDFFADLP